MPMACCSRKEKVKVKTGLGQRQWRELKQFKELILRLSDDLQREVLPLFTEDIHSDLTVVTANAKQKVSKAILAARLSRYTEWNQNATEQLQVQEEIILDQNGILDLKCLYENQTSPVQKEKLISTLQAISNATNFELDIFDDHCSDKLEVESLDHANVSGEDSCYSVDKSGQLNNGIKDVYSNSEGSSTDNSDPIGQKNEQGRQTVKTQSNAVQTHDKALDVKKRPLENKDDDKDKGTKPKVKNDVDDADTALEGCCELGQDLLWLYHTGIFSDVTLKAQDKSFNVHRCILCARCEYFSAMFSGAWREDTCVDLVSVSSEALHQALLYLYGGVLDIEPSCNIPDLAALADMYDIQGINHVIVYTIKRDYCHFFHHAACQGCVHRVPEMLPLSVLYRFEELIQPALTWISCNFTKVWPTSSFAQLPDQVMEQCCKTHITTLCLNNALSMMHDCFKVEGSLPSVHWTEAIRPHIQHVKDASLVFLKKNAASIFTPVHYMGYLNSESFGSDWLLPSYEEYMTQALTLAAREKMCENYAACDNLLKYYNTNNPDQEVTVSVGRLKQVCKNVLVQNASHLVGSQHWNLINPETQTKIKEVTVFVPIADPCRPRGMPPVLSSMTKRGFKTSYAKSKKTTSIVNTAKKKKVPTATLR